MKEVFADIILFDNVGCIYNGNTLEEQGMGGSEFQSILLLEELAKKGKKVICLNNSKEQTKHNGVLYAPNILIFNYKFSCKNLIIHRTSDIPNIQYKKCFNWITDLVTAQNLKTYDLIDDGKCSIIALSQFSANQFSDKWNTHVINFMIPNWVYDYKIPETKKDFVYASSLMKGYQQTILHWRFLKSKNLLNNKKLYVCLPGYDNPPDNISIPELNIEYLGSLNFKNTVKKISESEGLFYINMMPETFCITAVLCEILQTTPHIFCLNGVGALTEVLNSKTVSTNVKQFISNMNLNKEAVKPKNYKTSEIIEKWLILLND